MRRGSGLTGGLLLAAAVLGALATLRILTGGDRGQARTAVSPSAEPVSTPEQTALVERIVAAWKARQERAATFSFVWDSRVTKPEADANVALPPSGWWEERNGRLREDSVLVDYDDSGHWRQIAGVRLIHDGPLNSHLTVPRGTGGPPWITIWRGDVQSRTSQKTPRDLLLFGRWEFLPVLLAVRPMNATAHSEWEKIQVANEDAVVNNVQCVEIRIGRMDQPQIFWVDPKRDDVVVRWEGGPYSVSIDYEQDPKHGWLPSHWSWSRRALNPQQGATGPGFDGNNPASNLLLFDATVRSHSIGEPLAAETFAQTSPANTIVYDVTAGSEADWKRQQASMHESAIAKASRPAARADQPRASSEDLAMREAIAAAWAKRRAKLQSFRIAWQRLRAWNANGWRRGPATMSHMACAQGDRFALELRTTGNTATNPGSKTRGDFAEFAKTAFDGKESRGLSGRAGWIQTGFSASDVRRDDCLWLAVSPWDARFTGLDPARLRIVAQDSKIGDSNCVLVRYDWPAFFWLDRDRDFIVLRKQELNDDTDWLRADLSYRLDPTQGWIPTGWRETRIEGSGRLSYSFDDAVKEVTINQPIPASMFAVEFPKNAMVNDLDPEPLRDDRARKQAAATIAERWSRPLGAKAPPKPQYDPEFDARVDLEKALKAARETKRRVLIEFGGQRSADCARLCEALTRNAEIASALKKSFVLLLVDTDYRDAGQIVFDQFVPETKQGPLPLLTVMDPDETVLDTSDPTALKSGNAYAIERLKAYFETWAPKK